MNYAALVLCLYIPCSGFPDFDFLFTPNIMQPPVRRAGHRITAALSPFSTPWAEGGGEERGAVAELGPCEGYRGEGVALAELDDGGGGGGFEECGAGGGGKWR